jgi:aconitate hydratase
MLKVAEILKQGKVPQNVSLIIAPGSRQVLLDLTSCGALEDMIRAGARIVETACGFCNGVGQAPRSKGVSLRTSNRNFPGRSGTADAFLYLVSPETAAVSALSGRLRDPRTFGNPVHIDLPQTFAVDDSLIVPPAAEHEEVEIVRGPNIAPLPLFEAMPENLSGEILLALGDNVTTDDILPAGAHILAKRANIPAISEFIFCKIDTTFPERARQAGTGFIVGGANYGQGSSREHAALAPRYLGVRAVIAESFARIHKFNLVNFGILPLELKDPKDREKLAQGEHLKIDNLHQALQTGEHILVANKDRGVQVPTVLDVSPRLREVLLAGGTLNHTKEKAGK